MNFGPNFWVFSCKAGAPRVFLTPDPYNLMKSGLIGVHRRIRFFYFKMSSLHKEKMTDPSLKHSAPQAAAASDGRPQAEPVVGTPAWKSLMVHLEQILAPIGYEVVEVEILNHREKKLRVFIDLLHKTAEKSAVDIEDCVRVTHALDQPLEALSEMNTLLPGAYELEVSSPGAERPLRKASDFEKYSGDLARIQTFRSLTGDETGAAEYSAKNPKQRNFYGFLRGFNFDRSSVEFGIIPEDGTQKQKGIKGKPKAKAKKTAPVETRVWIPLELVAKAHLEPVWDDEASNDNFERTK